MHIIMCFFNDLHFMCRKLGFDQKELKKGLCLVTLVWDQMDSTLVVHDYILVVHDYILVVHDYILVVHDYILVVHDYIL